MPADRGRNWSRPRGIEAAFFVAMAALAVGTGLAAAAVFGLGVAGCWPGPSPEAAPHVTPPDASPGGDTAGVAIPAAKLTDLANLWAETGDEAQVASYLETSGYGVLGVAAKSCAAGPRRLGHLRLCVVAARDGASGESVALGLYDWAGRADLGGAGLDLLYLSYATPLAGPGDGRDVWLADAQRNFDNRGSDRTDLIWAASHYPRGVVWELADGSRFFRRLADHGAVALRMWPQTSENTMRFGLIHTWGKGEAGADFRLDDEGVAHFVVNHPEQVLAATLECPVPAVEAAVGTH